MHFEQYYDKIENVLQNHYIQVPQQKKLTSSDFHQHLGSKKYMIKFIVAQADQYFGRRHLKFLKGCLSQILLGPFLNTFTHISISPWFNKYFQIFFVAKFSLFNSFQPNVAFQTEISYLICSALLATIEAKFENFGNKTEAVLAIMEVAYF